MLFNALLKYWEANIQISAGFEEAVTFGEEMSLSLSKTILKYSNRSSIKAAKNVTNVATFHFACITTKNV